MAAAPVQAAQLIGQHHPCTGQPGGSSTAKAVKRHRKLGQQDDLDPLLTLLTLLVQPEAQLKRSTQQILVHHPELLSAVLTMLIERLPTLTTEELMVFAGIPTDQLLHTRAAQDLLDRGRLEGCACRLNLRMFTAFMYKRLCTWAAPSCWPISRIQRCHDIAFLLGEATPEVCLGYCRLIVWRSCRYLERARSRLAA